jgi:hypothetical protein
MTIIDDFRFAPDAAHAARCNAAMHAGLADSLRQIADASAGKVAFDRRAIERLIIEIGAGYNVSPNAFALYYDLVPALLEGRLDTAHSLFAELERQRPIAARLRLIALGDPALADREARYVRLMSDGVDQPYTFLAPTMVELAAFKTQFAEVCALLQQAAPELLGELNALISELVLVAGDENAAVRFDGGSSYRLWGALFLNTHRHETRVGLIEALAHESAHSRLFGLCIDETAVRNEDDELHASPLRQDPRPMDGVYHATFVSARMHWAMARLIASGLLTAEERTQALEACASDRRNFERGYDTVAKHAQLTDTGRKAMAAAHRYMSETVERSSAGNAGCR